MEFLSLINTNELVEELKNAVEELPGSGARGRSRLAAVESEITKRLRALDEIRAAYEDGGVDDVWAAVEINS